MARHFVNILVLLIGLLPALVMASRLGDRAQSIIGVSVTFLEYQTVANY